MRLTSRFSAHWALAVLLGAGAACSDNPSGPDIPAVPTGITATASGATTVTISYAAVPGATSYTIQRASAGAAATQIGTSTTTSYTDNTVAAATTYSYTVAASNGSAQSGFSAIVTVTTLALGPKVATLKDNIVANRTLYADTVYTLNGYVKVRTGATLTIQPGTKIVGDTTVAGSSLWITRGGKIDAQGTAAAPIVFTSARAAGNRAPGDWGGIIIVGNALVNRSAGGGVPTMFTEGPQGTGQNTGENYGGGTDANDNSGTLRYVRIEFAGFAVLQDQELNALSMYAVGRGTKIEYVQALAGLDDSFEWFGGSVDGRYLVSYDAGDDHFDWTEGYNGRNQFLVALQTFQPSPRAGAGFVSVDPRGFEGDGCEVEKAGCTSHLTEPLSRPVFANFSLVGPGRGVAFANITSNTGATLRRGTAGTFVNGIISRWQGVGINLRDAATDNFRSIDSLTVQSVVLIDNNTATVNDGTNNYDAVGSTCTATGSGGNCGTQANLPNTTALVGFATAFPGIPASGVAPTLGSIDWTPGTLANLHASAMSALAPLIAARGTGYFGATIVGTNYVGAADPAAATKWWAGWTNYARN